MKSAPPRNSRVWADPAVLLDWVHMGFVHTFLSLFPLIPQSLGYRHCAATYRAGGHRRHRRYPAKVRFWLQRDQPGHARVALTTCVGVIVEGIAEVVVFPRRNPSSAVTPSFCCATAGETSSHRDRPTFGLV